MGKARGAYTKNMKKRTIFLSGKPHGSRKSPSYAPFCGVRMGFFPFYEPVER